MHVKYLTHLKFLVMVVILRLLYTFIYIHINLSVYVFLKYYMQYRNIYYGIKVTTRQYYFMYNSSINGSANYANKVT